MSQRLGNLLKGLKPPDFGMSLGGIFIAGLLALSLIKVFYSTPLRTRVENKLYDLRVQLTPHLRSVDDVGLLAIDELTLEARGQEGEETGLQNNQKILGFAELASALRLLSTTNVEQVAVVLPSQLYNFQSPHVEEFINVMAQDKRFVLGLFDLPPKEGQATGLSVELRPIEEKVFKADMTRDFRREIIRDVVIHKKGEWKYLAFYLAEQRGKLAKARLNKLISHISKNQGEVKIRPNLVNPKAIASQSLHQWMEAIQSKSEVRPGKLDVKNELFNVAGKTIILGYTVYRPATFKAAEATFVNSPWQEEGRDVIAGLPLVTLLAMQVHSMSQGDWLKPAGLFVNILQTFLIAIFSLGVWRGSLKLFVTPRISIGRASIWLVCGWVFLLFFHSILFFGFSYYIPLADSALASVFMTIFGILSRLRYEGRMQAILEAKTLADREVALVQDRFLNTFAEELAYINQKVRDSLTKEQHAEMAGGPMQTKRFDLYVKALVSCEELEDYLVGIQHFSRLDESVGDGGVLTQEKLEKTYQKVELKELIEKVLGQFETRIKEKQLRTVFTGLDHVAIHTDRPIAAQILYNLLSNAIKYSPQGGTVSIKLEKTISSIRIIVGDEGPGIPKELQEKIFEKFYRVKNDLVYQVKGHGLGLYLSQYFAKLINSKIEVNSTLGQGSQFIFNLPIK